jgi:hypothetical protein
VLLLPLSLVVHRLLPALAAVALFLLLACPVAAQTPSQSQPDFNGDGSADLVLALPEYSFGQTRGGALRVLYGSASGLTSAGNQFWSQSSPGIPNVPGSSDGFGRIIAWGDFNSDGRDDLAVSVSGETIATEFGAGAVHVLYGSADGLTAEGNQFWHQNKTGVLDSIETGDQFGSTLAVADMDGDGFSDLAIGVPGEDVGTVRDAGAVQVLFGSAAGLSANRDQFIHQGTPGILDTPETSDGFGTYLAADDFDGDGRADLIVGVPREDIGEILDAGRLHVVFGSATGLTAAGNRLLYQDLLGVSDRAEYDDHFGSRTISGDFDGDGFRDLAVGVDEEDFAGAEDGGAVHIFYGSAQGLDTSRQQYWHRSVAGIPQAVRREERFGSALAVGDFDADGRHDLVISRSVATSGLQYLSTGALVLYGSPTGLTADRVQEFATSSQLYGPYSLAVADINGDSRSDLAVGVPYGYGSTSGTGAVILAYGSATGLQAGAAQTWTQATPGVPEDPEYYDLFGASLAARDFNGDGQADLAIGVPGEDVGTRGDAGALHILYGSSTGLTANQTQLWTQASGGLVHGPWPQGESFGDILY